MKEFAQMNHLDTKTTKELIKKNSLHDFLMSGDYSVHLNGNKNDTELFNKSQLYKFTFIRHPFDRLISAYTDKFVITPQANIVQPVQEYYEELYGLVTNTKNVTSSARKVRKKKMNITFKMFVDYLIHEVNSNEKIYDGSIHWWPFTNVCKVCDIEYDFVGKLENLTSDIDCLLENFSNHSLIHNVKTLTLKKINSAGTHTKAINR